LKLALAGVAAAGIAYAVRQRRRVDFNRKVVLIAGGSRGLGLELARTFVKEGAVVVLLARNQIQLAETIREFESARSSVAALTCDVSKEEEVRSTVASIVGEFGKIDVLVNNAGVIQVGPAEHMQLEDYAAAMDVHFWGPLYLMSAVIPHMKRQGNGRIVNIASIGGKVAIPHLLPYVASKFALVGLSEGMRAELAKDGIYVTTVSPGLMRTGSHLNAFFKGQHEKEFALFSLVNASPLLSIRSDRAARKIVEACRYGSNQVVITRQARLLRLINSLFPTLVAEAMSLACRVLPGPHDRAGDRLKRGWQSRSAVAPSVLTRPADEAALHNREDFQPAATSK
jgi:NAD(P)-dependent dehydrogenase (short-subunit alcohol dehydrogenase family)